MTLVNGSENSCGGRSAKQQKKSRSWRQRLANVATKTALLGSLLFGAAWCGTEKAMAVIDTVHIRNSDGNIVFTIRYHNAGETFDTGDISTRDFTPDDRIAIELAFAYWVERLEPTGTTVEPIVFNIGTLNILNAWCGPRNVVNIAGEAVGGPEQVLVDGIPVVGAGPHAAMAIGTLPWGYEPNTQLPESFLTRPLNANSSMESVVIHEIGHGLGIMGVVRGAPINAPDRWFGLCDDTVPLAPVFTGANATAVYGDVWLGWAARNVPLNVEGSPATADFGHFDVFNALMTHRWYRNYSGFMEVELASLNDIGYNIDLRNFFGRSVYTDNRTGVNAIFNVQGYFARNAAGTAYINGQENLSSYGLGLHVFGSNNHVTQMGHILANGFGGAGIRSDGFGNTIVIAPNTNVYANGQLGTGLLVAYGTNTNVIHRGDLQATGINGIAARFDFGQNALGNIDPPSTRNHFSYMDASLNGPLVSQFDVSGNISGTKAAIWIADNAHVDTINIMNNAARDNTIAGDIISNYTAGGHKTTLTFGKEIDLLTGEATGRGDAGFVFTYGGDIKSDDNAAARNFDLETWGGITMLNAATLNFNKGFVGKDTQAIPVASILRLPGAVTFTELSLGSAANTVSFLDGLTIGTVRVNTGVVENYITVQNLAALNALQLDNVNTLQNNTLVRTTDKFFVGVLDVGIRNRATGKILNNTTIDCNWVLLNLGLIDNNGTIDVNDDIVNEAGATISKTKTLLKCWSLDNGGIVTETAKMEVRDDIDNRVGGVINNAVGETITVGRDVRNVGTMKVNGAVTLTNAAGTFLNQTVGLDQGFVEGAGVITTTGGFVNEARLAAGNHGVGEKRIDTLNLVGALTNNAAGQFLVDIDPSHYPGKPITGTHNDLVNVTGAATINGGKAVVTAPSNDKAVNAVNPARYVANTKYTFLTTSGALDVRTALADEADETTPILLFDFVTGHDNANNYWLDVQREYIYGPFGDTFNQRAVGTYIDDVGSDPNPLGDFFGVLVALDKLNSDAGIAKRKVISAAAKFAEDQMSGAIYGSLATSSIMNTTIVNNTLNDVLRRDVFSSRIVDSYDESGNVVGMRRQPKYKRNIWGLGFGMGGNVRHDGNAYGYDQTFGGTIIGMDRRIGTDRSERQTRRGAYLSYGEGRIASDLLDRTLSKELLAGFYLRKDIGRGYALGSVGLGWNAYDTRRTISFVNRQALSDHGALVGTVYGEGGIDFKGTMWSAQPFFGLQYAGNKQTGFTETGANSLNLVSNPTEGHSLRSRLGMRFRLDLLDRVHEKFAVSMTNIWMHEMLDQTYTNFTARFSNPNGENFTSTSTFTVRGNDPGRDWAVTGFGLNYDRYNWRLFGGYDLYVNANQALHTGNGGVGYSW